MRIFFLTIVFFIGFASFSLKAIAQDNITANDNYILFKFMYGLNKAIAIKQMAVADTSDPAKINEAIRFSKISYQNGSVCYSPDKSFAIVSAEGADCSTGHCNCLNASRLYFTNSADSIDMAKGFLYADTIYKITASKYLVLQSSNNCDGAKSVTYKRATVFSIVKNKIAYCPITIKNDTTVNCDRGLALFQYNIDALSKYPFILNFDSSKKRLTYSYVLDTDTTLDPDKENYVSGCYEYKNGAFIQQPERKQLVIR